MKFLLHKPSILHKSIQSLCLPSDPILRCEYDSLEILPFNNSKCDIEYKPFNPLKCFEPDPGPLIRENGKERPKRSQDSRPSIGKPRGEYSVDQPARVSYRRIHKGPSWMDGTGDWEHGSQSRRHCFLCCAVYDEQEGPPKTLSINPSSNGRCQRCCWRLFRTSRPDR